ncbi:MAG: lipopolysaccharide kinase InaA family protein [Akkermansiaceae bacterium]
MSFIDQDWKETLTREGLITFDDWWDIQAEAVEPTNERGGWSNVITHTCQDGTVLYVKRQENFFPQNKLKRLLRKLTFALEFQNWKVMKQKGINVYKLVYFQTRKINGNRQAVLVSEQLENYTSMFELMEHWQANGWPDTATRRRILEPLICHIRKMHQAGILHNALSGMHAFLNIPIIEGKAVIPDTVVPAFIDFEGTKKLSSSSDMGVMRDLLSLNRRLPDWPNKDRLWFYLKYLEAEKLTPESRELLTRFLKRTRKLQLRP